MQINRQATPPQRLGEQA
ncbi:Protein of unknown function [Leuconostoc citreum LBAE C11]|nr:Protein of unknown function [Leuconostoc citreum LBAE C11]